MDLRRAGYLISCQGSFFNLPYKNDQTRDIRFRSNSIIGRGTIIITVECACRNCPPNQCDWEEEKLVLKMSLPSKTRVTERMFVDRCKELAQGGHAWVSNHLPNIIWSFDIPFRDGSPQDNFKKKFGDDYEMRVMRGIILEESQPLSSVKTAKECAQVFYDIIQCEFSIYIKHSHPTLKLCRLHTEMVLDEDTLGGHLSYEGIVSIVHIIRGRRARKTRGREWQLHLENLRQNQVG
ncbi:hypothetical protein F5890DRAFT_1271012 [Lentinula detonsa]|uniref:Uncharacterized protein n=1 Tax=Lentinula detonsa TaxID=2804962 RepID=A0AA38Q0S9_9AGAR|nr:hypothetical protein F5890DRAFT_1271012 [Lentinula detonsa]